MSDYRERTLTLIEPQIEALSCRRALDFGCGDGWFATQLAKRTGLEEIVPLDVKARARSHLEPLLYDGDRIPFPDHDFDLVYAIDVLHHCPEPLVAISELMRCTRRYLLIKDHSFRTAIGWLTLCILDELGNRRFQIPSLYHYQRAWSWIQLIEAAGFRRLHFDHPARVHAGLLGALTNRLQFIAIWERER